MNIYIFNPETDYALALGRKNYSPPSSIVELRKSMALFPATFASPRDSILILDDLSDQQLQASDHYATAADKGIGIIRLNEISFYLSENNSGSDNVKFLPWGWNHTLRRTLLNAGVNSIFLKSEEETDKIRELSHRRTTIPFQKILSDKLPGIEISVANEFTDSADAIEFCNLHPGAYFKAPWSSSGRGVINSSDMTSKEIQAWINGCIKRQGSIIGEIGKQRTGDFATEWKCSQGKAEFLGLSVFKTSPQGRYQGNVAGSQDTLWQIISNHTGYWGQEVIEAQKYAIESIISPYYDGPLGIDMFSTTEGELNPCVEINLRHTMGLATLLAYNPH